METPSHVVLSGICKEGRRQVQELLAWMPPLPQTSTYIIKVHIQDISLGSNGWFMLVMLPWFCVTGGEFRLINSDFVFGIPKKIMNIVPYQDVLWLAEIEEPKEEYEGDTILFLRFLFL